MMKEAPLTILVAEDNSDDVFFLQQAFRQADVPSRLRAVCDGMEAVAYLKGENAYADRDQYPFPDILLLDLNMPRFNGFEVLEWLRKECPNTQLVVHILTASGRDADVQRAYALGANSYLIKPSRLDALVELVATFHQWHRYVRLPSQPVLVA